MREVLLADVALWAALIIVAAWIIVRRWRGSHSWIPARGPREEALELAGRKAPELAGQRMSPQRTASVTGPGRDPRAPDGAAPRPARPALAAPPQSIEKARSNARPHRPAALRDGQPTPTRAATPSEQIVSYFDQADQPIADYLAALGWTQQPSAPPMKRQAQVRVLPQSPKTARPAP